MNPWRTDSRGAKRLEVCLQGGLGNQLFQFAAGWEIAHRLGTGLHLNTSLLSNSSTPRKFELEQVVKGVASWGHDSTSRHLFVQNGFSFDPNVLEIRNGTIVSGYFQSPKFFQATERVVLDLIRKSAPFHQGNTIRHSPFLAVQARRGDYLKTANRLVHGVVPEQFFLRASRVLRDIHGELDILVFSDDKHFAEALARKIPSATPHYQSNTESPLETLGLLSRASGLAISNSTFGWWGAYLAGDHSTVIAPRPWFRNLETNTNDLLPEKWLSLGVNRSAKEITVSEYKP